jgi:cysteine-rich repeat protein
VDAGEECDDGNTADGDGCSASCTNEVTPVCGDGILQSGEECDDGNTADGDGCSATCATEGPSGPEPPTFLLGRGGCSLVGPSVPDAGAWLIWLAGPALLAIARRKNRA